MATSPNGVYDVEATGFSEKPKVAELIAQDRNAQVVKDEIEAWRAAKRRKTEPMPEDLWQMAALLCDQWSRTAVAEYLGVTTGQLTRRMDKIEADDELKATKAHIRKAVETYPGNNDKGLQGGETLNFKLKRADGANFEINSDKANVMTYELCYMWMHTVAVEKE